MKYIIIYLKLLAEICCFSELLEKRLNEKVYSKALICRKKEPCKVISVTCIIFHVSFMY